MSLLRALAIAATGLSAQRTRMETVASNLANARTTRSPEGGPYRRQSPVFAADPIPGATGDDPLGRDLRGVRVEEIFSDPGPPVLRHEPGHPDADAAGFVAYPDVDPVTEMVDMLSATRSYEANVTVVRSVRDMGRAALEIIG
jgi:flagellar basal-body rod protein FlgC